MVIEVTGRKKYVCYVGHFEGVWPRQEEEIGFSHPSNSKMSPYPGLTP